MKLENLTMKKVQKLAEEAISVNVNACSKYIAKNMLKMGVGEKSSGKFLLADAKGIREVSESVYEPGFFVNSVDFVPNEDYECKRGFAVYGARGVYFSGRTCGPASFVLVWNKKMAHFFLKEIVFALHPFAETDKKIIFA